MAKPVTRTTRLRRAKNLLAFHLWTAQRLRTARILGTVQTQASYRAALLTNAKVLRAKLVPHTLGA